MLCLDSPARWHSPLEPLLLPERLKSTISNGWIKFCWIVPSWRRNRYFKRIQQLTMQQHWLTFCFDYLTTLPRWSCWRRKRWRRRRRSSGWTRRTLARRVGSLRRSLRSWRSVDKSDPAASGSSGRPSPTTACSSTRLWSPCRPDPGACKKIRKNESYGCEPIGNVKARTHLWKSYG